MQFILVEYTEEETRTTFETKTSLRKVLKKVQDSKVSNIFDKDVDDFVQSLDDYLVGEFATHLFGDFLFTITRIS